MQYNQIVRIHVQAKLSELATYPLGAESGRRITADDLRRNGITLTDEQLQVGLESNFTDVAQRLGVEFFHSLPAVALEQFALMSIMRNEDCAGMLKSLINSFMVAYITQDTSGEAFAHLQGLEGLRARVAISRNQTPAPMKVHPARSLH